MTSPYNDKTPPPSGIPTGGGVISVQKRVVEIMIRYYCGRHHDNRAEDRLCDECRVLLSYAHHKLDRCPYGEHKPNCSACKIHCYTPERRMAIKQVMRYAGPRMFIYAPREAMAYIMRKLKFLCIKPRLKHLDKKR